MALTQEQIQQYRQKYGIVTPTTTKSSLTPEQVSQYRQKYGIETSQPQSSQPFKFDLPKTPESRQQEIAEMQRQADLAQAEADKFKGLGFFKQAAKSAASIAIPSEIGLGKSISAIASDKTKLADNLNKIEQSNLELYRLIKDKESKGQDTTALKRSYNANVDTIAQIRGQVKENLANLPTTGQLVGQIGGTALDALTVGTYGRAAAALPSGKLALQRALPSVLPQGGKGVAQFAKDVLPGAAVGYGYDVTTGLQEGETLPQSLVPGLGTAIGAGLPIGVRATSNLAKTASRKIPSITNIEKDVVENILTTTKPNKKAYESLKRSGINAEEELVKRNIIPKIENGRANFDIETFDLNGRQVTGNRQLLEERQELIDSLSQSLKRYDDLKITQSEILNEVEKVIANDKNIYNAGRVKEVREDAIDIINDYVEQSGRNYFSPEELNFFKSAQADNSSRFAKQLQPDYTKSDSASSVATALKKIIEDKVDDINIRNINKEIGKLESLNTYLAEKVDGTAVKGGRLGIYTGRMIGAMVGAGSDSRNVVQSILGAIGGDAVARVLQANAVVGPLKRYYLSKVSQDFTNPVLKDTLKYLDDIEKGLVPKAPQAVIDQIKNDISTMPPNLLLPEGRAGLPQQQINTPIQLPSRSQSTLDVIERQNANILPR